ncbi:MAG: sugar-binding domain-containing protein, partial [Christensenellales bacterium]
MLYRFLKRVVASVARFAENVVPAHAHVVPFSDRSVCDDVDYFRAEELSDRVVFLNGKWDFCYFSDGFAKNGFDSDKAEFVSVDVPESWESMGFGQKRYLTEYGFLHSGNKVFDGKKSGNSSGVYKKIVPIYDLTKKYFLNFDKVNGAFEVYVNGAYCGFSALGYGEFDVTDKIVSGDNEILVAVKKYTAASFADGFKGFENTGIVGDVYFVARNEQYLADVTFSSVMSAGSYKGKIALELSCVKADSFVTVTLEKDGKSVLEIKKEAEKSIECEFTGDFLPYLAEKPELYDLYVSISETGFVTECSRFKVGFGKLLYEDGVAVYNDRPIKLFGVDYNAVRASDGSRMSYDDYCADFALIKDFGFNAICPKAYLPYGVRRLAQSKGLYIIDPVPVAVAKELSSKGKHNFVAYATDYRDL